MDRQTNQKTPFQDDSLASCLSASLVNQPTNPTIQNRTTGKYHPSMAGITTPTSNTDISNTGALTDNSQQHCFASILPNPSSTMPQLPEQDDTAQTFPCKARGIGEDHDATTAKIFVPRNSPHGTLLVCTHHTCRSMGRQFRWCRVCQIPVAKGNFETRHYHNGAFRNEPKKSRAQSHGNKKEKGT